MPHETPFENTPGGQVRRWKAELKQADKSEQDWRKRARQIVERFRDEDDNRGDRRYNILWANTETLKPQMYSETPSPAVQRRFHDIGQTDQLSREVAQILERSIEYAIDSYDFDGTMEKVVLDHLLTGRGIARVRYVPTIEQGETSKYTVQTETDTDGTQRYTADFGEGPTPVPPDAVQQGDEGLYTPGEPPEEVTYEEARCEYVNWEDFRLSPARTWEEVRWVAFRHRMLKSELVKEFGKIGHKVPLDFEAQDGPTNEDSDEQHVSKRATVWEIWHKDEREVIFIAEGMEDRPLEVRDDPLGLEDFFPCPEPLYSVPTNNTMVPIPEYTLYQDQAIELNRVTTRIDRLVEALKARGLYAGEHSEALSRLMRADDNELIPMEDFSALQGGSLEDNIAWLPIEQIANVILQLRQHRQELLEVIYQVTGISDIMRGDTDPRETRGAQQLKGQFGVMRLQPRQRRVQKFIRDLLALKAEIMAEHFDPETFELMTGHQVPEEATNLLRDDTRRGFRIDIETDSTIAKDEQEEKQKTAEFMEGMARFVQQAAPAVQGGLLPKPAAKELVKFALKKFQVSRDVEEALEAEAEEQDQQPDPIEMAKIENERAKIKLDQQKEQNDKTIRLLELKKEYAEMGQDDMQHRIDAAIDLVKHQDDNFREEFNKVMDVAKEDERARQQAQQQVQASQ